MKRTAMPLILGIAFLLNTMIWAQTSTQSDASVNGQTSVQTNQTNAQVSTEASSSSIVSTEPKQANAGLAADTAFNATLVTSVDSRKVKAGDEVTAHTTESVIAGGKTILPKGTKLVGHVTQASARAKGDAESALGIAFDRAILKNGHESPLSLAIQALASGKAAASASGGDMDAMADAETGVAASGMTRTRGAIGGATSVVGSSVGAATNTVGKVGGAGDAALNSTLNSAAGVSRSSQAVGGLNASGQLSSNSRGVFNLNGISLSSGLNSETQSSMVTSVGKSVHLDSGTRMLLVTQAAASAKPN
jgi:hypothetical protein